MVALVAASGEVAHASAIYRTNLHRGAGGGRARARSDGRETGNTRRHGALLVPSDRVVDTCGAGDVFHGAYVFSYLRDPAKRWEEHFRFAAKISAFKVQHRGNEAGLPTLQDIENVEREFETRIAPARSGCRHTASTHAGRPSWLMRSRATGTPSAAAGDTSRSHSSAGRSSSSRCPDKSGGRKICGSRKCRSRMRQFPHLFGFDRAKSGQGTGYGKVDPET